jgi:beta propeller repeat protein
MVLLGAFANSSAQGVGLANVPICNVAPSSQRGPDVFGSVAVWHDARNWSLGTEYDIYTKDIQTGIEQLVCNAPKYQLNPAISDDWVVWRDYRNDPSDSPRTADIYARNLSSGQETALCTDSANQGPPAIDGNIVVWDDNRNGTYDVYGYDLLTQMEFPICRDPGDQVNARVSGTKVIWSDYHNPNTEIRGIDLSNGQAFTILTNSPTQTPPDISGEWVVWNNGTEGLYATNLVTHGNILVRPRSEAIHPIQSPVIAGDLIVWYEGEGGGPNPTPLFAEFIPNGSTFPVCTQTGIRYDPATDGNIIVWVDERNGNADIYGAYVPEPVGLSLLAIALSLAAHCRAVRGFSAHHT